MMTAESGETRKGKVQTVLGCIEPAACEFTLPHEHLKIELSFFLQRVTKLSPPVHDLSSAPIQLCNYGWINRYPYCSKENLRLHDNQEAIDELIFYQSNGGKTIVDSTTYGIGRDVTALKQISEATGVHVIAGAGYYVNDVHPACMTRKTEEELCNELIGQVTEGCDGTNVKCGLIGEIGCSWHLTANEKKVLRATALAQQHLGCAVNIHPGRNQEAPFEIIRIVQEVGIDIQKTTMSHLDRTLDAVDKVLDFADLGSFCEWDLFGIETSYCLKIPNFDMPSDGQRMGFVQAMIAEGRTDQILISHDIHTKHRLYLFIYLTFTDELWWARFFTHSL